MQGFCIHSGACRVKSASAQEIGERKEHDIINVLTIFLQNEATKKAAARQQHHRWKLAKEAPELAFASRSGLCNLVHMPTVAQFHH